MANISLSEAAQIMERDHGYTVKIGSFESFGDFLNYFGLHYKTMLEQLRMSNPDDRVLCFFCDDMLSAFDPTDEL